MVGEPSLAGVADLDSWRIAICGQAEELAPALAERGLEAVIVSPAEVLS